MYTHRELCFTLNLPVHGCWMLENHGREYLSQLRADKSYNRHKWLMHICKHVHEAITSKRHYVKCTNFKLDWFVEAHVIRNNPNGNIYLVCVDIDSLSITIHSDSGRIARQTASYSNSRWNSPCSTHMCHDLAHCWVLLVIILWNFGQLNGN